MKPYRLIPGIVPWIESSLAALKLRPLRETDTINEAIGRQARYYMAPMVTAKKTVVWFKASLQQEPHLRRALREEIRVQQLFAAYEKRTSPHFDSPSYIAHHDARGRLWLVRRYWDGMFAGDMTEWFGFSPSFFRAVRPQAMAAIVDDIRGMSAFFRRRSRLEVHGLGWYMLDFHYYEREFLRPMLRRHPTAGWTTDDVDRIAEALLSAKTFFARHANTFTHGDMYPTNIMVRSTGRRPVVVFDWELAHANIPTFDAVMVYLHAWRNPRWQRQFRLVTEKQLGQGPTTSRAWALATLSLATRLAGFCYIRLNHAQPNRYPRLPASQRPALERAYHIFLREMRQALTDLE